MSRYSVGNCETACPGGYPRHAQTVYIVVIGCRYSAGLMPSTSAHRATVAIDARSAASVLFERRLRIAGRRVQVTDRWEQVSFRLRTSTLLAIVPGEWEGHLNPPVPASTPVDVIGGSIQGHARSNAVVLAPHS